MERIGSSQKTASESVFSEAEIEEMTESEGFDKRQLVKEFSWGMAANYFIEKTKDRLGKWDIYFMEDGTAIHDKEYLTCVTAEICKEFGIELLNVMADLILPVGFGYPSLRNDLQIVIEAASEPQAQRLKTVVWIEDENWNTPGDTILEILVRQLLCQKAEPFLIAPTKYFDKEVVAAVFNVIPSIDQDVEVNVAQSRWNSFANLLEFGFLLALRSSAFPIVLLHFSQKLIENIDAFRLIDIAEAEGHNVRYLKNDPLVEIENKEIMVADFVASLVSSLDNSPPKKIRLDKLD